MPSSNRILLTRFLCTSFASLSLLLVQVLTFCCRCQTFASVFALLFRYSLPRNSADKAILLLECIIAVPTSNESAREVIEVHLVVAFFCCVSCTWVRDVPPLCRLHWFRLFKFSFATSHCTVLQKFALDFSLKFLRCPYLEKRIQGEVYYGLRILCRTWPGKLHVCNWAVVDTVHWGTRFLVLKSFLVLGSCTLWHRHQWDQRNCGFDSKERGLRPKGTFVPPYSQLQQQCSACFDRESRDLHDALMRCECQCFGFRIEQGSQCLLGFCRTSQRTSTFLYQGQLLLLLVDAWWKVSIVTTTHSLFWFSSHVFQWIPVVACVVACGVMVCDAPACAQLWMTSDVLTKWILDNKVLS